MPAPAYAKSYHRRLVEVALVAIVLGVVFLGFWYGVLGAGLGPSTWTTDYCKRLLAQYESTVLTETLAEERTNGFRLAGMLANGAKFVEMLGQGDTVSTCAITVVSERPVDGGFGDAYACPLATVKYKTESKPEWLLLGVQTELLPEAVGTGGASSFSTLFMYYNPNVADAKNVFDLTVERLKAHECVI